jgi:Sulfotransferase family
VIPGEYAPRPGHTSGAAKRIVRCHFTHDVLFWHSHRGGIFTFATCRFFWARTAAASVFNGYPVISAGSGAVCVRLWVCSGRKAAAGKRYPVAMHFAMPSVESIFLLNPPFSGSTAMADLLLKSPVTWSAWSNGEGQWVEEVTEEMRRDPWNPEVDFEWPRIRAAWMKRKPAAKSIMVEKSPPNLLRVRSIIETFENSIFVVSNRDPYAWLGGVIHHENYRKEIRNPQRRREIVRHEISQWVFRSRVQIGNIELVRGRSVITRYQEFCGLPQLFLQNLYNYCGDLRIDARSQVRVKSYPVQGLVNMNARQISRLNSDDIAAANEILDDARPVLEFFGYECTDPRARSAGTLVRFSNQLRGIMRSRN